MATLSRNSIPNMMSSRQALLAFQVLEQVADELLDVLRSHRADIELAVSTLSEICPRYEHPNLFRDALREMETVLEGACREYHQHKVGAQTPNLWFPYQQLMNMPSSPLRAVRFLDSYRRLLQEDEQLRDLYNKASGEDNG